MTLEEAQKVGNIVAEADGGCSVCVAALVKMLNAQFPQFSWQVSENDDTAVIVVVTPREAQ